MDRDAASQALINLIADLTWAGRKRTGRASLQRTRDEAIALLPMIEQGDREATRRAIELVTAAGTRAAA